jgi:hypothetical protein
VEHPGSCYQYGLEWYFPLWIALLIFFSPVIFFVCVHLPELPVMMARQYLPRTYSVR